MALRISSTFASLRRLKAGAFVDTANEDLAADDADLEFLLPAQPPRDLSERATTINRRGRLVNRVLLRVASMAYAFLFGVALATGYEMTSVILIGVALACAWVMVETL